MARCYILFSSSLDKYYVGSTQSTLSERINKHNTSYYGRHFTSQVKDWELYLGIACSSIEQARKMETYIKRMKSRKYIQDLKRYPEMIDKLHLVLANNC